MVYHAVVLGDSALQRLTISLPYSCINFAVLTTLHVQRVPLCLSAVLGGAVIEDCIQNRQCAQMSATGRARLGCSLPELQVHISALQVAIVALASDMANPYAGG